MPTGVNSLSFSNNSTFLAMLKPSLFPNVFQSAAATYDSLQMFIEQMNPAGSIREDNVEYQYAFYPPIMQYLVVASNGSLNASGNLEIQISNPNNVDLSNVYRPTELVSDRNYIIGRVVEVINATQTLVLAPVGISALDPSIHFTQGSNVSITGNAQPLVSDGMDGIYGAPEYLTAYNQFMREGYQANSVDFIKPTWAQWNGNTWSNKDIVDMVLRYKKKIARTDFYGIKSKTGSGKNTTYTYEGIRQAVKERSNNYFGLSTPMTEEIFQNYLEQYLSSFNGGVADEIVCSLGRGAQKVMQKILAKYVVTAGNINTFGGYKVEGININYYAMMGVKIMFVHTGMFDDTTYFKDKTILDTGTRASYTWFFHTNQKVGGSNSMKSQIVKHHHGPKEFMPAIVRGMVDPSIISPSLEGLNTIDPNVPITSLSNTFTLAILGSRSLEINPERMMLIEYIV